MGLKVGIFSCKGGVGKSLIAVNLGAAMARTSSEPTLVVDSNPALGTLDLLVDLESEYSWRDLIPVRDELTWSQIEIAVNLVEENFYLLTGPNSDPGSVEHSAEVKQLDDLVAALSGHFRQVILDGFSLQDLGEVPFRNLDLILYIVTPDISSVRSCTRYLQVNSEGALAAGVIVNQWFPESVFNPVEIEKLAGIPVLGVLPIDGRSVWENINLGKLIVSGKNNKLKKALMNLGRSLCKSSDKSKINRRGEKRP